MIRIRKRNDAWYIRIRHDADINAIQDMPEEHADCLNVANRIANIFNRSVHEKKTGWSKCDDLADLRKRILSCASTIDYHVRIALAVMNGTSDLYMLQDGELVSKQRSRHVPFPTLSLKRYENVEMMLRHINSGAWKVRTWIPNESIEIPSDYLSASEIPGREYLILESRDETLIPYETIY
jgi:hypothetical protein